MSEEGQSADAQPERSSLLLKTGRYVVAAVAVPSLAALLLGWTLIGRFCSMGGGATFVLVAALTAAAVLIEADHGWEGYAFESSLLDPACVLLVAYSVYVLTLQRHDVVSVEVMSRRRLSMLPLAVGVAAYLSVKIFFVSEDGDGDRWRLAWVWVALVASILVYVSMARWWTDASNPRLKVAEAALLEEYGQVPFEQSVVSGLGTVCVEGFNDPEDGSSNAGVASGKPILVLMHGYAAGNAFWMFTLKELSAHFRVVCVEMYGCGRSDRLAFDARGPAQTERLLVESLEKWRVEMKIEEMVLCGHSLGGMVAAAYAMAYPHRLRKLVLLSPAGVGGIPDGGNGEPDSFGYKVYAFLWTRGVGPLGVLRWCGPFGARVARVVVAKRLSWVPESAKIREVDSDLLGEYVYQLLALPASGEKLIFPLLDPMLHAYRPVGETLKGGGAIDREGGGVVGEGRGISCPVSIIYGSPDHDWMPHRHGVALAEVLREQGIRANVYTVPEAGHTLIIDNPVDFTRIFLDAYFNAGVATELPAASGVSSTTAGVPTSDNRT